MAIFGFASAQSQKSSSISFVFYWLGWFSGKSGYLDWNQWLSGTRWVRLWILVALGFLFCPVFMALQTVSLWKSLKKEFFFCWRRAHTRIFTGSLPILQWVRSSSPKPDPLFSMSSVALLAKEPFPESPHIVPNLIFIGVFADFAVAWCVEGVVTSIRPTYETAASIRHLGTAVADRFMTRISVKRVLNGVYPMSTRLSTGLARWGGGRSLPGQGPPAGCHQTWQQA
ncbi:MAG: hypothetical protein ACRD3T_19630 [Terriglobia bacterium]